MVVLTLLPALFPLLSLLTNPPLSSHSHLPLPLVDWGLAVCVRVGLWLRDGNENARHSRINHVRTYAALTPHTFVNLVTPSKNLVES